MKKIIVCIGLLGALLYGDIMVAAAASAAAAAAAAPTSSQAVTKESTALQQKVKLTVWKYEVTLLATGCKNTQFLQADYREESPETTLSAFSASLRRNWHTTEKVYRTNSELRTKNANDLLLAHGSTPLKALIPYFEKGEDGIPYLVLVGE